MYNLCKNESSKGHALIAKFSDPEDAYVLQSKSKIYRLESNLDEALKAINKAISNGTNVTLGQKAAFLNDKAETLKLMSDQNCLLIIEDAIAHQKNPKTKNA